MDNNPVHGIEASVKCDESMSFYRGAFYKSAEVISMLCDELDKEPSTLNPQPSTL